MNDVEPTAADLRTEALPHLALEGEIARISQRDVGGPSHTRAAAEELGEPVHGSGDVLVVDVFDRHASEARLLDVCAVPDMRCHHDVSLVGQGFRSLEADDGERRPVRIAIVGKY